MASTFSNRPAFHLFCFPSSNKSRYKGKAMRLYFAASLIAATIFLAVARPVAASQVPKSDFEYRERARHEFAVYDPTYESSRAERTKQARVLGKQVFQREAAGQPSECSHQILNEISWLLGYTADFKAVDRRLKDLENTLADPKLELAAAEQDPADGSWGGVIRNGFSSWMPPSIICGSWRRAASGPSTHFASSTRSIRRKS